MTIEIKEMSLDRKKFFNVIGSLNVETRKLTFELPLDGIEDALKLNMKDFILNSDSIYSRLRKIYIKGIDNKYYSCLNCIFSYNVQDSAKFSSVAIDIILENIISDNEDIKTRKIVLRTYYLGHSIHNAFVDNFAIKYSTSIDIVIKKYLDVDTYIDIIIESKKDSSYKKLSKISYTILEMILLIFGDMPIIKDMIVENEGKQIIYDFEVVDKYRPKVKKRSGKEILGCINIKTINKESIKKFEKFRKDTKIIYDLLSLNINSEDYKEIKNCNLVQIMEGLYKTLIGDNNLGVILKYYFKDNKSISKLLDRRDKRIVKNTNNPMIFLYKANNHRNYLSHLNLKEFKNVFYNKENIYAYWKLCMAIRIFILQYIGISYDKSRIIKYRKEINVWAKKNKLRFSSKTNHKI